MRVLSEILKRVLPYTIFEQQSDSVEGRQILDKSLIANKLIDEWKRKKKGIVVKLDIEKAFGKVNLDFLEAIIVAKGFGQRWIQWIIGCISSTISPL